MTGDLSFFLPTVVGQLVRKALCTRSELQCSRGETNRFTPCETAWNCSTLERRETASNSLILSPQSSKFKSPVISGMMKPDSLGGSSFGAHEREHQPDNRYSQARGIETHSDHSSCAGGRAIFTRYKC